MNGNIMLKYNFQVPKIILLEIKLAQRGVYVKMDYLVLLLFLPIFMSVPVILIFSVSILKLSSDGTRKLFSKEEKSLMNRRVPDLTVATSVSIFMSFVISFIL